MEHVQTELKSRFFFIKGRRVMRNITETCAKYRRRFTTKIGSWIMAHQIKMVMVLTMAVNSSQDMRLKTSRVNIKAKSQLFLFNSL